MVKKKEVYHKIEVVDDWGNAGYYLGPIKSKYGFTHSHEEQDKTKRLKNKDKIKVKWPDGSITNEVVTITRGNSIVYDMGHEYSVNTDVGFLKKKYKGVPIEIGLEGLRASRR